MHVNFADFVYKAMGELIQVLYHCKQSAIQQYLLTIIIQCISLILVLRLTGYAG